MPSFRHSSVVDNNDGLVNSLVPVSDIMYRFFRITRTRTDQSTHIAAGVINIFMAGHNISFKRKRQQNLDRFPLKKDVSQEITQLAMHPVARRFS